MAKANDGALLPGWMPNRLPEGAPAPDFDATAVAKALLRTTRAGALATIDRNTGHPFGSLVNDPHRQLGKRQTRITVAGIDRARRPVGTSTPDRAGRLCADRA